MSTPRVIHIPKGGLPRVRVQEDPDTPMHKACRKAMVWTTFAAYVLYISGGVLGVWSIQKGIMILLSLMVMVLPFGVHVLLRPGKGKTWCWSLFWVAMIFYIEVSFFLVPAGVIFFVGFKELSARLHPPALRSPCR